MQVVSYKGLTWYAEKCKNFWMSNNKQLAYERDAQGLCVVCGEKTQDRRRGLCTKHYEQYRRSKIGMTDEEIEDLEEVLVEQGRLMPSIQGKKPGAENVFADVAAAIKLKHTHRQLGGIAEDRRDYETASDEPKPSEPTHPTAADVDAVVRSATKRATPKPPADSKTAPKKKRAE